MAFETTNPSLLRRAAKGHEPSWMALFQTYQQPVVRFGIRLGLQEGEAKDVLQETMIDLIRVLPAFEYDPDRGKFRNFVSQIARRKIIKFQKKKKRRATIPLEDDGNGKGPAVAEREGYEEVCRTEAEDLREWRVAVLESCLVDLKNDSSIASSSFEIFTAYAIEGLKAKEVAERFNTSLSNVYQIRMRFVLRLREMVKERLGAEGVLDYEQLLSNG